MNEESFCKSGILRPKRTQNDTPIVTLSETKGLLSALRVNSLKNLLFPTAQKKEILRLRLRMTEKSASTQNDERTGVFSLNRLPFCHSEGLWPEESLVRQAADGDIHVNMFF